MRIRLQVGILAAALALQNAPAFAADAGRCGGADQPIDTDRPDTTNSSTVVPVGSLQSENGVDVFNQSGDRAVDGPNSRLRLGVAPCLEVLVDLPSYVAVTASRAPSKSSGLSESSGFGDVAPAVKWQISPDPGHFDLSATFGAALPTGRTAVAGAGLQPYLQFPWSTDLTGGWDLTGMLTFFARPADRQNALTTETTLTLAKELTEHLEIFAEYVGDFADRGGSRQMANSGVLWRVTKTQQLDMHFGFGLDNNAPNFTVGAGYSFRIDGLFK
jgi:hypothetical protein